MQHYGIMRIYDAKNKIFSKLNSRLDWLLTLCAFVTVVIYSPEYFHRILDHNQRVGVPFLSAELTFLLKKGLFYVTMGRARGLLGQYRPTSGHWSEDKHAPKSR